VVVPDLFIVMKCQRALCTNKLGDTPLMLCRCAVLDEHFNDAALASSTKTSARAQFAVNSCCFRSFSFDFRAFSSLGDSFLAASVSRFVGASTSMVKPDNNCNLPQQWTPQVAVVVWMVENSDFRFRGARVILMLDSDWS
jgi:hypothetical protein